MNNVLYSLIDTEHDPEWTIKEFFNRAYADDLFVRVALALNSGRGFSIDEDYCLFPDEDTIEDGFFEGVKFGIYTDSVIITRDNLQKYLLDACGRYLLSHPEDTDKLRSILKKGHPHNAAKRNTH